jgi:hypothetical protein
MPPKPEQPPVPPSVAQAERMVDDLVTAHWNDAMNDGRDGEQRRHFLATRKVMVDALASAGEGHARLREALIACQDYWAFELVADPTEFLSKHPDAAEDYERCELESWLQLKVEAALSRQPAAGGGATC